MTKHLNRLTIIGLLAIVGLVFISALAASSSDTASAGETAGTVPVETPTPDPEPTPEPTPEATEEGGDCEVSPVLTPSQEQFFFETDATVNGTGFPCEAPINVTWQGATDGVPVEGAFAEHQVTTGADGTLADSIFLELFAINWTVTATDADGNVLATATFVDPTVGGVIAWELRVEPSGTKTGGATFSVSGADGAPGPRYCSGDSSTLTVIDNGLNDVDTTAAEFRLNGVCPGVYNVTETIAPAGSQPDPDPTRLVNVNSSNPLRTIGGGAPNAPTGNDDCGPDPVPATDGDLTSDFCNPTVDTRTLRWEVRLQNDSGGATVSQPGTNFVVSGNGNGGPFHCRGNSDPITVIDNTAPNDTSSNNGTIEFPNVCAGNYIVTQTTALTGLAIDPDPTREVTVPAGTGNTDIGVMQTPQECPDSVPGTDAEASDFCNPTVTTGSLRWEKRSNATGSLVSVTGATFTVGGAVDGPFKCRGITTNPVTVIDNISNDAGGAAGTIQLSQVCPGTYTVTETIAPPGFSLDPDPDRVVTLASGTVDIGTNGSAQNCPDTVNGDGTGNTDLNTEDFCNPTQTMRTIEWEKRDQGTSGLIGGTSNPVTFTVGGASGGPGPFACRGDATNPVTVADDNATVDNDTTDGQIRFFNVCPGVYIVTETIAPPNYGLEPDPTRQVDVNSGDAVIGTQLDGTQTTDCVAGEPDTDEEDFCNSLFVVNSISWEKRDHATTGGPLLGGAAFSVGGASGPWACIGNPTNPIIVIDDFSNDSAPLAGQLKLENACPGAYTVTETTPPTGRVLDPDPTRSVTVSTSPAAAAVLIGTMGTAQSCPDGGDGGISPTDGEGEDFCNPAAGFLELVKNLEPSDDPGLFNLDIDGGTDEATNVGDGGTTGQKTLTPGSHAIEEIAGTDTSLDDYETTVACIDTANANASVPVVSGAVQVDAGDDIVCTFTNTRETGTIEVCKVTEPANLDQDFSFITDFGNFELNDADVSNCTEPETLPTGEYDIGEEGVPFWALTSINCGPLGFSTFIYTGADGGSNDFEAGDVTATVTLAADEDIVCTFTNIPVASLTIEKDVNPEPDGQDFDFQTNCFGPFGGGPFILDDDADPTNSNIKTTAAQPVGDCFVQEMGETNYFLKSIVCAGDAGHVVNGSTVFFDIDAGETISCVWTNTTGTGTIQVCKEFEFNLLTDTGQDAAFFADWKVPNEFPLGHDECEPAVGGTTLPTGDYFVSEIPHLLPVEFRLDDITCLGDDDAVINEDGATATLILDNGENVVCTFTNVEKNGGIQICKVFVGDDLTGSETATFESEASEGALGIADFDGLTLGDGDCAPDEASTFIDVLPGTYNITETPIPAGFELTDIDCGDYPGFNILPNPTPGPDGNTLQVTVGDQTDVTCTFTNTQLPTGTITICKQTDPDTDTTTEFDFTAEGPLGPTFTLIGHDDCTDETEYEPGDYDFVEDGGNGFDLTDIDCGDDPGTTELEDEPGVTVGVSAGDDITCTFTNSRRPTLEVIKQVVPDNDTTTFDLDIDSGTEGEDKGDGGTTGPVQLAPGEHTVSETFANEDAVTGYDVEFTGDCDEFGDITLEYGDIATCTITNSKRPTLTVNKEVVPATDTTLFDLDIDGVTEGEDQGDGGTTGAVELDTGEYKVSETFDDESVVTGYDVTFTGDCDEDGDVTLAYGDELTCTITNSKRPTLTVNKEVVPDTDTTEFDLDIDGVTEGEDQGDGGTTGAVELDTGEYKVSETFDDESVVTGYDVTFTGDCDEDGDVTLEYGDELTCTITNSTRPTLEVIKQVVPDTDTTEFDLDIDDVTEGEDKGDEGTTGAVELDTGVHTVSETFADDSAVVGYGVTFTGDCDEDGDITLEYGDTATCTITNEKLYELELCKFYDANGNGVQDYAEPDLEDWPMSAGDETGSTGEDGCVTLELKAGAYTGAEGIPTSSAWKPTTPASVDVTIPDDEGVIFGNVCLGAGGGHTLGFWSNKNGQTKMNDGASLNPELLALRDNFNLRNANGTAFNPTAYNGFKTWLLNATATNMAYMLSAQLAAMYLNVEGGYVSGTASVWVDLDKDGAIDPGEVMTVNALIAAANTALGADGSTLSGDANRPYQEALKIALDRANNNQNFLQSSPCTFSFPTSNG